MRTMSVDALDWLLQDAGSIPATSTTFYLAFWKYASMSPSELAGPIQPAAINNSDRQINKNSGPTTG